jgi:glutamate/tyrosine decarboxylase-like PLP-dependent enzyme
VGTVTDVTGELLHDVASYADGFLSSLAERPVRPDSTLEELRRDLDRALQETGCDARDVLRELVALERGVVASAGPRYFGFVIGGSLPASLAADWLAAVWDQNAFSTVSSPLAAVVEEVAGAWIADLLGIPAGSSFGFVTGTQTAHVVALAAARDELLTRAGWESRAGLFGAPPVRVIVGAERHVTVDRALRILGLGEASMHIVPADDQGRLLADALGEALASSGSPTIVCLQAGNVNSGAFDPFAEAVPLARSQGAWVHVDGAFGLWAAASPQLAHLTAGHEQADSWATDAHKWLNVPYDSGLVFVARPNAHRAATSVKPASYLEADDQVGRDPAEWTLESSRRARGLAVWAALRSLGRRGVIELIESRCAHARRFAAALDDVDGIQVLNEVVLNQVVARIGDSDDLTESVIRCVQSDGTCWLGGTTWGGKRALRISISGWRTRAEDVDRSVEAIVRATRSAYA